VLLVRRRLMPSVHFLLRAGTCPTVRWMKVNGYTS